MSGEEPHGVTAEVVRRALIHSLQTAMLSKSQARQASASGDRTRGPQERIGERSLPGGAYRMGGRLGR